VSEAEVADYPKDTAYERSKQLAERLVLPYLLAPGKPGGTETARF